MTPRRAIVTVTPRALWRLRLARELPRYAFYALALAGLLASARFAIAPPRPSLGAPARAPFAGPDLAAQGFASLFARSYLSWRAGDLEARERLLAPFLGSGMGPDAGLQPPPGRSQRVLWTQVVQEREAAPREHVYTLATETDSAGLLYLTVSVLRRSDNSLALAGYPAFVGPPASSAAAEGSLDGGREVLDPMLTTVVTRTLRNYLAGSPSELQADLTSGARVSLPGFALTLQSLEQLRWAQGGGSVIAVAQAQDARGAQYTLGYELDVTREQGRWEVAAIQMNPDS